MKDRKRQKRKSDLGTSPHLTLGSNLKFQLEELPGLLTELFFLFSPRRNTVPTDGSRYCLVGRVKVQKLPPDDPFD